MREHKTGEMLLPGNMRAQTQTSAQRCRNAGTRHSTQRAARMHTNAETHAQKSTANEALPIGPVTLKSFSCTLKSNARYT